MCGGRLSGQAIGATEVAYEPGPLAATTEYEANTAKKAGGGAGAVMLLLQIALPIAVFCPAEKVALVLKGGTNGTHAPTVDFFGGLLQPALERFCGLAAPMRLRVERRGYFPEGGGRIRLEVVPMPAGAALHPIVLAERGQVVSVRGVACTGKAVPAVDGEAMVATATEALRRLPECVNPAVSIEITTAREQSFSSGGGLTLWAETTTGARLSGTGLMDLRNGVPAPEAAGLAVSRLASELAHGGAVDRSVAPRLSPSLNNYGHSGESHSTATARTPSPSQLDPTLHSRWHPAPCLAWHPAAGTCRISCWFSWRWLRARARCLPGR
jgi:RNA 3'-terminal phosphate cyclase (ATP)